MFLTNYSKKKNVSVSCCGSYMVKKYRFKINKDGSKELTLLPQKEWTDRYKEIQLYKDDADIYSIISRMSDEDLAKLDHNQVGRFFDISEIPDNINDIRQVMLNGYAYFESLPLDFRDKFGNDFGRFAKVCEDGKYSDFVNEYVASKKSLKQEPKQEPEQEPKQESKENVENGKA